MSSIQADLFEAAPTRAPLVIANGVGVNSQALLILLHESGIRPDLILFADTGDEKDSTYRYLEQQQAWLKRIGFPPVITVRYQLKDFKDYPVYSSLSQNCLTNGTLPGIAFGRKSCSLKWKVAPQDKYVRAWRPAQRAWHHALSVRKMIGYDASPKDMKRFAVAKGICDNAYNYEYPLIEEGLDRDDCKALIEDAGLPVPPKSACVYCTGSKPHEILKHKRRHLVLIVAMEARAAPRLRTVEGLWRKRVKGQRGATPRPGSMTDFIREQNLLPHALIDRIISEAPTAILHNQERYRNGFTIPSWHDFLELFTPEDEEDVVLPTADDDLSEEEVAELLETDISENSGTHCTFSCHNDPF